MCTTGPLLANAILPLGFCAKELPVSVTQPRSILSMGASSLLALERGTSSVVLLDDTNGDGLPDSKATVAAANSLNHGLALHNGYLYASSDEVVYRWEFIYGDEKRNDTDNPAAAVAIVGERKVVISNINADGQGGAPGGHTTRTLAIDSADQIYVSVGSAGNVDPDSFRSRIRRFDLTNTSAFPLDFLQGEVFADGLRNEVGLAFDRHGVLWGVENGADRLQRSDLGGDIHNDNPAEEVNRFREEDRGKHWGYPYCFTEYWIDEPYGLGRGTTWAWPSFLDGEVTDELCRTNYEPPVVSLQAHTAPLGITFFNFTSDRPEDCTGGFPEEMDGYAFIALHGSWNRDVPVGYSVVYLEMDGQGEPTSDSSVNLLTHTPPNAEWDDGFRPVDVDFDDCGRLLVSSDGTNNVGGSKIVRIEYNEAQQTAMPTVPPRSPVQPITSPTTTPVEATSPPSSSSSRLQFGAWVPLFLAATGWGRV